MADLDSAFVLRVLSALSFDGCDDLWWRTDGEYAPVTFFIKCSDTFAYACADLEQVTPDNVAELERAIADCVAVDIEHGMWGPALFVARIRRQRPTAAWMRMLAEDHEVARLFEACAEQG